MRLRLRKCFEARLGAFTIASGPAARVCNVLFESRGYIQIAAIIRIVDMSRKMPLDNLLQMAYIPNWRFRIGVSTKWPGVSPGIFYALGRFCISEDLSIFVDESGGQKGHSKYCIVTLVFHVQSIPVESHILSMMQNLKLKSLPNIPFHASPLMYGKDDYSEVDIETRKRLLSNFEAFCRRVPFTYKVFAYLRSKVSDPEDFAARLKRDLVVFLSENLNYFQSFDCVKIYYDDGQQMVSKALHEALDFMISKEAILYKTVNPKEYCLFQIADYLCTINLTELKFQNKELTETDIKFFGTNYSAFKKGHLKHLRCKELI